MDPLQADRPMAPGEKWTKDMSQRLWTEYEPGSRQQFVSVVSAGIVLL